MFKKEKISSQELSALKERVLLQQTKELELQILKNELNYQYQVLLKKYNKEGSWTVSLKNGVLTENKTKEQTDK